METDEILAREARQRPRAAAAAGAAAILIVASFILAGTIFADAPRPTALESLGRAAEPGPVGGLPSLSIPFLEYITDNTAGIVASAAVRAVGYLLFGLALTFLAFAIRARMERFGKVPQYAPIVGGVLSGIALVLGAVSQGVAANEILDGPRTVDAAADATTSSLGTTAQFVGLLGLLSLAIGAALVSLNAMRVGLLTRFMGVLGMLAAALTVLEISPIPVVQCVWLTALAVLFLGRWPGGMPPAWRTGRAEPWPTQQELREQRDAARAGGSAPKPRKAERPVTVPAGGGTPHPASRKKKRKRRS